MRLGQFCGFVLGGIMDPSSTLMQQVIVKALPRVCMKNTARGECRVVNTARGEAECCIYHETPECCVSYTQT